MSPYFSLIEAERDSAICVEVPHAGLSVPEIVRDEVQAPQDAILRDADIYVDRLTAEAPARGAALLVAKVSRYVVDLNRAADDVDALTVPDHPDPRGRQARGVVWRTTTDGRSVLRIPLNYERFLQRIERFHAPYHRALEGRLQAIRARHGYAILVAMHSMPSVGRAGHADTGTRRADVVPGTLGRTTADPRVIELVDAHFRDAGLKVRHDEPYRGGYTTGYYGRPQEGWHAIQIELNRALYVNEATQEPIAGGFEALRESLGTLFAALAQLSL